jgi:hypothetical protein
MKKIGKLICTFMPNNIKRAPYLSMGSATIKGGGLQMDLFAIGGVVCFVLSVTRREAKSDFRR